MALHHKKVKSLSEQSKKLVEGGHFDAASISKKAAELESRLIQVLYTVILLPCAVDVVFFPGLLKGMLEECFTSKLVILSYCNIKENPVLKPYDMHMMGAIMKANILCDHYMHMLSIKLLW